MNDIRVTVLVGSHHVHSEQSSRGSLRADREKTASSGSLRSLNLSEVGLICPNSANLFSKKGGGNVRRERDLGQFL